MLVRRLGAIDDTMSLDTPDALIATFFAQFWWQLIGGKSPLLVKLCLLKCYVRRYFIAVILIPSVIPTSFSLLLYFNTKLVICFVLTWWLSGPEARGLVLILLIRALNDENFRIILVRVDRWGLYQIGCHDLDWASRGRVRVRTLDLYLQVLAQGVPLVDMSGSGRLCTKSVPVEVLVIRDVIDQNTLLVFLLQRVHEPIF